MIVDWLDFYDQSIKEGWKSERTKIKIRESVSEVFGPEYGKKLKKD